MASGALPRPGLVLLLTRPFGGFIGGVLAGAVGTWIHSIAATIVVFEATGSATMVGVVTIAKFALPLVLGPWAGSLTDRHDRRAIIWGGCAASAAGGVGLALALPFVHATGSAATAAVIVSSFVTGLGFALSSPAKMAIVPALVTEHQLDGAIALNSAAHNLARTLGPALGAYVVVAGGASVAFAAAGLAHVPLALVAVGLPRTQDAAGPRGEANLRDLLGYLRGAPGLRSSILMVGAVGLLADPVVTLGPALADSVGRGDAFVGLLASSFGLGAVLALAAVEPLRRMAGRRRQTLIGLGLLATGFAGVAMAPTAAWMVVGYGTAGLGYLTANTALTTQLQRATDERRRGRVMALWGMAFLGSRPLAAMANGATADVLGVRPALLLSVLICVVVGAYLVRARHRDHWGTAES